MNEGSVRVTADGRLVATVKKVGKRVRAVRGYRKVPPREFAAAYLSGEKMKVIAQRWQVSVQACKAARRRLGLPARPPHRKGVAEVAGREKLPERRKSWTQKVKIPDAHGRLQGFYLTFSEYPDGKLGEVWIDASLEGTFLRGVLGALARMISLNLQSGVPAGEVAKSLRGMCFPPSGKVVGSEAVAEATSVVDWVAQEMTVYYGSGRG